VNKSYNFAPSSSLLQKPQAKKEKPSGPIDGYRMSNGYIIALACGPLRRQRYINTKIELELRDFKQEIEDKFSKSKLATFAFPRMQTPRREQPPARHKPALTEQSTTIHSYIN
jgi:hypothetical protein